MSEARLRSLRMVGFKSFAERTVVEFGPGISAVVGPNGSGKSNLADALRWTLGEQGRSLRTRRAEDVIFAGSSSRRAIGMADVALTIDNGDGLLPVDFEEVELGRRLFRSGENEYLLNRQRVRLKDLVDLLDAANLADNAFLFIGQGMVDQALALRPEERRPLFEEAAGIRRHERRRRQAESELAQAESNLERARDVLAELRPQARRLAAQAEQQEARRSAGSELAAALVAAARSRLVGALSTAESHRVSLAGARADAERALADLRAAEAATEAVSRALGERAERERVARTQLDAARDRTVELRLTEARLAGDLSAIERDEARIAAERAAAAQRTDQARRVLAGPEVVTDRADADELADVVAALAEADRQLRSLRDADRAEDAQLDALRRERESWTAETERLRRRASDAERTVEELRTQGVATTARLDTARTIQASAHEAAAETRDRETEAERASDEARAAADVASAAQREAAARLERARADRDRLQAALAAADADLTSARDDAVLRSARARHGQRISDGLEVEASLRVAVEAVLEDRLTAILVDQDAVTPLAALGNATLLIRDATARARATDTSRAERAATDAGGGRLDTAVRRDPTGCVAALLARSLWVPDLAHALTVRPSLPAGWSVVTASGQVVTDDGTVRLGTRASRLERQATRDELERVLASREPELQEATTAATAAAGDVERTTTAVETARRALDASRTERRVAEDSERAASRDAELAGREDDWTRTRLADAERETASLSQDLASLVEPPTPIGEAPGSRAEPHAAAIAGLEGRVGTLRERRERLASAIAESERRRDADREQRRRAELTVAMDDEQRVRLDAESSRLVGAGSERRQARERTATDLAAASAEEARLATAVEELMRDSGEERGRLLESERAAGDARERLRAADGRIRSGEVAEMEARLQGDGIREQLLVELAGIGGEGLDALAAATGSEIEHVANVEDLAAGLEETLTAAMESWQARAVADGEMDAAPSASRLGSLRRRYHELGASNPFAAEEYAEVRARLDTMESQRADLESAIASTRQLIGELSALISGQFRATFTALEDAFGRRFRQLFDGGEAQLSLTDPEDLSTTGVEITARPPGKKRQPLAMLSGGERALTAVALLMAMLEVRPVPFCVLDEVDAALDEANIERFSAALRSLAETIQFIVITHNRGTIEAADALYGVTVGDDAVSRVISLRLGEVELDGHRAVAIPVVGEEGERVTGSAA